MLALKKFLWFICIIPFLTLCCTTGNYKLITNEKIPPKAKNTQVELFVGKLERPHKAVAIIQSKSYDNKFEHTKVKQLEEIQKIASKLNLDAVHNIHLLENKMRGFVTDYQVPFKSWKQGKYTLYFLRGEGVIYLDKDNESSGVLKLNN